MLAPPDYTQTARAFVSTKILHYIKPFNQWLRPGITLTQQRRDNTRCIDYLIAGKVYRLTQLQRDSIAVGLIFIAVVSFALL